MKLEDLQTNHKGKISEWESASAHPTERFCFIRDEVSCKEIKAGYPKVSGLVFHGDNRTRTCDPLHVKQMLSQLSYVSVRITIAQLLKKGKRKIGKVSIFPTF